jgi:hypothetical protein
MTPNTCDICGGPIEIKGRWRDGNNAEPVVFEGRCCDVCDNVVVIPARIFLMKHPNMSEPEFDRMIKALKERVGA